MPRNPSKLAAAYRNVFSGKEGLMVLADLMKHCKVYTPIEPTDAVIMAFENGQRNVGLRIATLLNYRESEFAKFAQQHNEALIHE